MNESSPGTRTTNLDGEDMNLPVLFPSQQELLDETLGAQADRNPFRTHPIPDKTY